MYRCTQKEGMYNPQGLSCHKLSYCLVVYHKESRGALIYCHDKSIGYFTNQHESYCKPKAYILIHTYKEANCYWLAIGYIIFEYKQRKVYPQRGVARPRSRLALSYRSAIHSFTLIQVQAPSFTGPFTNKWTVTSLFVHSLSIRWLLVVEMLVI